ncbi:hypothetical protein JTE90_015915, partial [Oedothorax gibbosus]
AKGSRKWKTYRKHSHSKPKTIFRLGLFSSHYIFVNSRFIVVFFLKKYWKWLYDQSFTIG